MCVLFLFVLAAGCVWACMFDFDLCALVLWEAVFLVQDAVQPCTLRCTNTTQVPLSRLMQSFRWFVCLLLHYCIKWCYGMDSVFVFIFIKYSMQSSRSFWKYMIFTFVGVHLAVYVRVYVCVCRCVRVGDLMKMKWGCIFNKLHKHTHTTSKKYAIWSVCVGFQLDNKCRPDT